MKRTIAVATWLMAWASVLLAQGEPINRNNVEDKVEETWELIQKERTRSFVQANQILSFSTKNKFKEGEAESKAILGVLEMHKGDWQQSNQLLEEALQLWQNLKNNDKSASVYIKLATTKHKEGDIKSAFEYAGKALELLNDKNNSTKGYTYLILGNLFVDSQDSLAAIEHYNMAGKVFEKNKNLLGASINKYEKANFNYKYDNYDEALELLAEIIPFFEQEKNLQYSALSNNVLGAVYYSMDDDHLEEAKEKYNICIQSAEKLGDTHLQFDGYINLSLIDFYVDKYLDTLKEKRFESALKYAEEAERVLDSKDGALNTSFLHEHYIDIYKELGNYKKAFDHLNSLVDSKDRLYNKDVLKAQEKSRELSTDLLRIKAEKKQFQIIGFGGFILLLAMWRMNYLKQRNTATRKGNLMLLQQKELEHQQRELKLQKEIDEMVLRRQVATAKARLKGEKEERDRIAATIHDRLGSQLAAMRWSLEASIVKPEEPIPTEPIKATLSILNKTHKDLRVIVKELELDNFEWKSEIESFLQYIQKSKKIETKLFTYGLDKPINRELSEDVYDILLQLIGNVLEHSNADQLNIEINHMEEEEINILLEDNGDGFPKTPVLIKNLKGSGLKNIENKVTALNGTIDIDSKPGHGAIINIAIPVKNKQS